MNKPLILVTNDDGITAPGIRHLIKWMSEFGAVYVVAPDKPQSGMGHAITVNIPLYVEKRPPQDGAIAEWSCSGTPADCVKLAKQELLPRKPDLCVSGINHGSNASINVIYSGTMSAAIEASIEGIPSIGFSLCDMSYNADFNPSEFYVKVIAKRALDTNIKGLALNVNIPAVAFDEIKGIKTCIQAHAQWEEKFEKRKSPFGKSYYWLTGTYKEIELEPVSDLFALSENYISIVPVKHDLTDFEMLKKIQVFL